MNPTLENGGEGEERERDRAYKELKVTSTTTSRRRLLLPSKMLLLFLFSFLFAFLSGCVMSSLVTCTTPFLTRVRCYAAHISSAAAVHNAPVVLLPGLRRQQQQQQQRQQSYKALCMCVCATMCTAAVSAAVSLGAAIQWKGGGEKKMERNGENPIIFFLYAFLT